VIQRPHSDSAPGELRPPCYAHAIDSRMILFT